MEKEFLETQVVGSKFEHLDNLLGRGNYSSLATTLEKSDGSHWVRIHISKVLSGKASYSIDLMNALIKHTGAKYEDIQDYIGWVRGGKE